MPLRCLIQNISYIEEWYFHTKSHWNLYISRSTSTVFTFVEIKIPFLYYVVLLLFAGIKATIDRSRAHATVSESTSPRKTLPHSCIRNFILHAGDIRRTNVTGEESYFHFMRVLGNNWNQKRVVMLFLEGHN